MRRIRSRRSALTMGRPDGADSSTPRTVELPAGANQPPSPAAPPAANAASSSTASIAKPRTFGPYPSAAAAVRVPSTRRVAAEAQGSRAQLALRTKTASQCPEEDSEPSDHNGSNIESVRIMQMNRTGRLFKRHSLVTLDCDGMDPS